MGSSTCVILPRRTPNVIGAKSKQKIEGRLFRKNARNYPMEREDAQGKTATSPLAKRGRRVSGKRSQHSFETNEQRLKKPRRWMRQASRFTQ